MKFKTFKQQCLQYIQSGFIYWDNIPGFDPPAHDGNTLSLHQRRDLTGLFLADCSLSEIFDFMMNADDEIIDKYKDELVVNIMSGSTDSPWASNLLLLTTDGFVQDLFNEIVDDYKFINSSRGIA